MTPDDVVSVAADNPVVLRIVTIVAVILAILAGAEKIGGKVGKWITAWTTSRRRTAEDAKAADRQDDDADREDMHRQIKALTIRVKQLSDLVEQQTVTLIEHQNWDRQVLQRTNAGAVVGPPPPLWPISQAVNP